MKSKDIPTAMVKVLTAFAKTLFKIMAFDTSDLSIDDTLRQPAIRRMRTHRRAERQRYNDRDLGPDYARQQRDERQHLLQRYIGPTRPLQV